MSTPDNMQENYETDFLENVHPGQMLRDDFLQPLGITPATLAGSLGLSRTYVSKVLHGQRKITPLTSLLLGKFFGMSAPFWLSLQNHHDFIEAQRKAPNRLERVVPFVGFDKA